jgi:hypothetical protein
MIDENEGKMPRYTKGIRLGRKRKATKSLSQRDGNRLTFTALM